MSGAKSGRAMGISIPTGTIKVREIKRKRGVNSVFQFQQVQFKFSAVWANTAENEFQFQQVQFK